MSTTPNMGSVVSVLLPNAASEAFTIEPGEIRTLVRMVMRCAPPGTRAITMDHVARAIGVARNTLTNWCAPRRRRVVSLRKETGPIGYGRSAPYAAFYCLQVLAANPKQAWESVFASFADGEPRAPRAAKGRPRKSRQGSSRRAPVRSTPRSPD